MEWHKWWQLFVYINILTHLYVILEKAECILKITKL